MALLIPLSDADCASCVVYVFHPNSVFDLIRFDVFRQCQSLKSLDSSAGVSTITDAELLHKINYVLGGGFAPKLFCIPL